ALFGRRIVFVEIPSVDTSQELLRRKYIAINAEGVVVSAPAEADTSKGKESATEDGMEAAVPDVIESPVLAASGRPGRRKPTVLTTTMATPLPVKGDIGEVVSRKKLAKARLASTKTAPTVDPISTTSAVPAVPPAERKPAEKPGSSAESHPDPMAEEKLVEGTKVVHSSTVASPVMHPSATVQAKRAMSKKPKTPAAAIPATALTSPQPILSPSQPAPPAPPPPDASPLSSQPASKLTSSKAPLPVATPGKIAPGTAPPAPYAKPARLAPGTAPPAPYQKPLPKSLHAPPSSSNSIPIAAGFGNANHAPLGSRVSRAPLGSTPELRQTGQYADPVAQWEGMDVHVAALQRDRVVNYSKPKVRRTDQWEHDYDEGKRKKVKVKK
ncbi:hypothetical protein HKX48_000800, partial [Thoreauomyces humboldtii]